ncbi:biopolymer transport protein ExbD/TolR [Dysgonomonas alginatilytica]|uniref:Biopolymer transport protein ExbD/TolR n=1 Tax=Dysgonomonas alginatilytica TaxID=1605892 RepID=A0A2V3PMY8_9BACT|nr:biopolymer transporter ExbD [Dysgonomonas alginatilytica]PXV63519.1 biopolymer transport protein ExbD/TolR [Dysgonomonas alginatilytica]
MAEMNTSSDNGGKKKKGQPTKMNLRVDFTPMVDMNMLLITFFMLCTTLSAPQVMDIVMPAKSTEPGPETPESKTVTLLLSENDQIFYYWGKAKYDNPNFLQKTDLSEDGLRNVLLERNSDLNQQVTDLKSKKYKKEISEEQFKNQLSELKKSRESITVIVKPTNSSTYNNLVKTLDEMQICSVAKYAIVDVEKGDNYLIENFNNFSLTQAR